MNHKQLAEEIYALSRSKRKAALDEIPIPDRGMVRSYMDKIAQKAQSENRRRNIDKTTWRTPD